ncbi:MAG: hypothetical protein ACTSQZ_05105 [Candidatus Thorarchaeota archaeon]
MEGLEIRREVIIEELTKINALDCEHLSKELIKAVTGRQEEVSSRILRGVDELHRVLRYNMLDVAGEGDIIRATVLWLEPFVDDSIISRTTRFAEAAERGADVRYLLTTDIFNVDQDKRLGLEETFGLLKLIDDMRKRGKKFDFRLYAGPNTYNQISFNRESMALVITENPMTATWITRRFNPDLIDNAVKTFDKDWKSGKSTFDLTPKDFEAFGVAPEALIRSLMLNEEEDNKKGSNQ